MGTGGSSIALLLPVTGPIRPVSVGPDLRSCAEAIGARLLQYVPMVRLPGAESHVMMTDEEGLLQQQPVLNARATWLARQHIVGDVLITAEDSDGSITDLASPTYWADLYTATFEREGYSHG